VLSINQLENQLKDFNFKQEALELLYVLKAWQILSRKEIERELSFTTFYNNKIEAVKLVKTFDSLSKKIKLFSTFSLDAKMFSNKELIALFTIVVNNSLPKINEVFYNQRNHDFCVSPQIAKLGLEILNSNAPECNEIYIPFTNGFAYCEFTSKKIYADFPLYKSSLVSHLLNIIENANIEFSMTNALEKPTFLKEDAPHILKQFTQVFSAPPLRVLGNIDASKDIYNRFEYQKGRVLDIAHFEHILAQTKSTAVVLTSVGFTYRGNFEEEFRKYLCEKNYIQAIIQLPPNLFMATSIETTLFVLNKEKSDDRVYFLNLKDEQFITREGKKFVLKNLEEIVDIYINTKELDGISSLVKKEDIIKNNYSLSIDRYVNPKEQQQRQQYLKQFKLIALEDIADARRSQLFKDEQTGIKIYEISPYDFSSAGFTYACGKIKEIGSQDKKLQTYKLEPFDVLLSSKGVIGKVAIVGETTHVMVASQAIQVIRIKSSNKKDNAIALYMFLKSKLTQNILFSLVSGASMPQISPSDIKQLSIPVLTNSQQKQLIDNFNKEQELDNQIKELNKKIDVLHNTFFKVQINE